MDAIGMRIFTGMPPILGRHGLVKIAAKRFDDIKSALKEEDGDMVYYGHRCSTMGVSHRFASEAFRRGWNVYGHEWRGIRGWMRYKWACLTTYFGWQDRKIERVWHERASAEHWYMYEKEWD